jgi:hypothetical protein
MPADDVKKTFPKVKAEETPGVTAVEIDDTWNTVEYWEGVAESVVRVTTAGFAGSLIGLAKERYQQNGIGSGAPHAGFSKVVVQENIVTTATSLPRRPPQIPMKAVAATNLPIMWSVSFMLFAIILESSRLASPTSKVFELADTVGTGTLADLVQNDETLHERVRRQAMISFGDYTFGGTVAGLAGTLAQRRHLLMNQSRPTTIRFGLATGFALGVFAGTLQAAIDVGNIYLEKERSEEVQQRAQEAADKELEEQS